jgi:hypothetical protein
VKRYMITGLAETCPLCIEPVDGRSKSASRPIFQVACEGGGYTGPICAAHVAALIKASEPEKATVPPKTEPPKPTQVASAGTAPPAAQAAK